ncbi:hypothetical protein Ahia01_000022200 [Argonauta hians]
MKEENFKMVKRVYEKIFHPDGTITFQTINDNGKDKTGFLVTSERFKSLPNEVPGPGKYEAFKETNHSFSKKGVGGLASATKRSYSLSKVFTARTKFISFPSTLNPRCDFNRSGNTWNFKKNIAEKVEPFLLPAPNQYNIKFKPKNIMAAQSAFRSQSKREAIDSIKSSLEPGPAQYHIETNCYSKSVTGPFKSQSNRIRSIQNQLNPGPGTYDINTKAPTVHKAPNLKRPPLVLSMSPPPKTVEEYFPGPGTYEIPDIPKKTDTYAACPPFMSASHRMDRTRIMHLPGPGYYSLSNPKKQSFNVNLNGKWI